jgi:hypothetical protein
MSEENQHSGNKISIEKILLIVLLGGNVTLGGLLGFSGGEDKKKPEHTECVQVDDTCEFKLAICEFKLDQLSP